MSNTCRWFAVLAFAAACVPFGAVNAQAEASKCATMRKINVGVSVAPPNVVHTSPYIARDLGFFAKRCIDVNIIQFEGGQSATSNAAAVQGSAIVSVSDVAVGNGMKVQQFWGLAPRMPQAYMTSPDVKTAKDLKGKKMSATGGGVGGFNWRMGREVLRTAGLSVEDAQFIAFGDRGAAARIGCRPDRRRGAASGRRLPRQAAEADVEPAGATRRSDAELSVQFLRRISRVDREGPCPAA